MSAMLDVPSRLGLEGGGDLVCEVLVGGSTLR